MLGIRTWLVVAAIVTLCGSARADDPAITRIDPPEKGFFAKRVDYAGIAIKAHADVSDEALRLAYRELARLLGERPEMAAQLAHVNAELHIIGKDQVTSDLPEWRHMKGKPFDGALDIDQRTRGMGGGPVASCGEENLLGLATDRYRGFDICAHEFAHTIATVGVPREIRTAIEDHYQHAIALGLWKTTYASTNVEEYFAELTMWYFGSHGDKGSLSPVPAAGRAWLESYDPDSAAFLDDLYTGRLVGLAPARVRATRDTGAATTIQFANTWSGQVRVWWLDDRGARHLYRTLAAGEGYDQATYAGHAWLVTNARGDAIAAFIAEPVVRVARVVH